MKLEDYLNVLKNDYDGWDNQYKFVINNINEDIPFAYSRFNDGEMMGIKNLGSVVARGDQLITQSLQNHLKKSIKHKQKNYFIGVPCSICYLDYYNLANSLVGDYEYKVSAVACTNRNWAKFITELTQVIKGKKIRFISGSDQKVSFLTEKMNFNIVDHIKLPNKNTWQYFSDIKNYYKNINENDIIFISLGPTSRILSQMWFEKKPNSTYIDIGSILDPFTRNVRHNCHIGWEKGFNKTKKCEICN